MEDVIAIVVGQMFFPICCARCCASNFCSCVADGKPLEGNVALNRWLADFLAYVADG